MSEARKIPQTVAWRTSSYTANGGNCVEVAFGHPASVPLRDTKVADGPVVVVSRAAFAQLIGMFGRS
ncbi:MULTISPECIES: DUF397 domain-containing protein [Streptomyces]|uniref:DUF397 domain-containing protein n=1 Tax=Streptomyces evansiae TaxID=3075535 RepID=A0ABU2R333_9ACTN|nr:MULTISPECIES: DUF397 domain-containing protein [unclassified Streptomyces]EFL00463.1 predicted protein [Streptomyces sp. SPB78]MDT0411117.1 DUF397 domain-containing protein [Streptomyces sp. DSM 41979]MYQ56583.1 DUF397 domain-containing protein [Streptomyces sp. SID4926]SCD61953.1 protein of unknown function [Streptomyces sp. DfronAA-171]